MYNGIETSEMPRLSEELVEQEQLKRNEIFGYEMQIAALNGKLMLLEMELAAATAEAALATPAAAVTGETGQGVAEMRAERINAIMQEIELTEIELREFVLKLRIARSELESILRDEDMLYEEVKDRAVKVKSIAAAGRVTGAYRDAAQRMVQYTRETADKLEQSAGILGRYVDASFQLDRPAHAARPSMPALSMPYGDKYHSSAAPGTVLYSKKLIRSAGEKNAFHNRAATVHHKEPIHTTGERAAFAYNGEAIRSVGGKAVLQKPTSTYDKGKSHSGKGHAAPRKQVSSQYKIPDKRKLTKADKIKMDKKSAELEKAYDDIVQERRVYMQKNGITESNRETFVNDKQLQQYDREVRNAFSAFNNACRSNFAAEGIAADLPRYKGFKDGNKDSFIKKADIIIDRQRSSAMAGSRAVLHGKGEILSVKKGRSYRTVQADLSNVRHTVNLARKRFLPSSRNIRYTQMPDLYTFVKETGTLHIAEQKNYSIEDGLSSLKTNIAEQAVKRITHCLNVYASTELTGLSKPFYVDKLTIDFNIDVKGHYRREDGSYLTILELKQMKEEIVKEIKEKVSDKLMSHCSFHFFLLTGKNTIEI